MRQSRSSDPDLTNTLLDSEAPPPPIRAALAPRRTNWLEVLGMAALMAVCSAAVAWFARDYVRTSPRFNIADVVIEGAGSRPNAIIERVAGIERGINIFSVDLADARARLLRDPWVSAATLARQLPGTINIHLALRDAAAIVALDGLFLSTRDGELFKRIEPGDPTDLPIVTGLSREGIDHDLGWTRDALKGAISLAEDYDHSPLALRAALSEVHVAASGAMTLVVGQDGLRLEVGKAPFREKLEDAARVVAEATRRGTRPGAILLDNDARPDRVVVRLK